jgi:hypothetical protein
VTATAGDGSATVSWTVPASDGGSPIIFYTVTPFAGGTAQTPVTVNAPATTTTVTGLFNNGPSYTFTVTATNAVGTSLPSQPSNPVTPLFPATPNNTGATAVNLGSLACGGSLSRTGDNNHGGSHAWYTFTFNQNPLPLCTLSVNLSGSADVFDVHLGQFTAAPVTTGVVGFMTETGGTYYIDVYGGTTGTPFSLQITAH